jgi:hypothetical protein
MCGPKSIEAPNRKLRRINKALDESYRSFASEARNANGVTTSSEYRGWPRDWTEPATDSWRWLIQEAEEPNFETRVGFAYHTDYMFRGRPAWPADDEIALEERVFLLLVRDLHIDHCRALQGLLHAIRYWRSNTEPFKPPVVAVALANERRGSDAYVVLCDEAKKLPSAELRQLNETLRSTVRPIWAPGRINFVDALPSTPWSMS